MQEVHTQTIKLKWHQRNGPATRHLSIEDRQVLILDQEAKRKKREEYYVIMY